MFAYWQQRSQTPLMDLTKRFYWFVRLFIRCGGWVALIPLLIGIGASIGSLKLHNDAKLLAKSAVTTTGVVVAKRVAEGKDGYRQVQTTSSVYYLTIRFTPKGHSQIEVEDQVPSKIYRSHDVGQTIDIRHLPDDPQVREYYAGEKAGSSKSTQVVGAAFALFGFGICFWFSKTALRALRARENVGMMIEGYVTHRAMWPPLFNRMQYQVGEGGKARLHNTFIRPMYAYRGLKRGAKTSVAITSEGPYWANDLFL